MVFLQHGSIEVRNLIFVTFLKITFGIAKVIIFIAQERDLRLEQHNLPISGGKNFDCLYRFLIDA